LTHFQPFLSRSDSQIWEDNTKAISTQKCQTFQFLMPPKLFSSSQNQIQEQQHKKSGIEGWKEKLIKLLKLFLWLFNMRIVKGEGTWKSKWNHREKNARQVCLNIISLKICRLNLFKEVEASLRLLPLLSIKWFYHQQYCQTYNEKKLSEERNGMEWRP